MSVFELRQDVVVALRSLRSRPSYALVVVLTLGLGIAANSLIFSFMNPYLIRELPYGEPERLVQLGQVDPVQGWDGARFSLPQFEDWKERSRSFDDLAAYYYGVRNLTGEQGATQVMTGVVSANLFDVLRVDAAIGRTFAPGEDGAGGANVVVLRHGLWMRRFGGDPAVLDRSILIDGTPHTVVGVMPPDFNFPFGGVRMWVPLRESARTEPRGRTLFLPVGRLKADVTLERAAEELESIQRELGELYPDADKKFAGVNVQPLRAALNFGYDMMLVAFTVLLAAVGFVLLIACVNVASLTMARASAVTRDVALRRALGAGRGRILRQLLTESVVLAAVGGVIGVVVAQFGVRFVGPLIPEDIFRIGEFTLDRNVLLFSAGVTLATPVIFGLLPALGLSKTDLVSALKSGRGVSRASTAKRRMLVVVEVAMAIVLIGATGLMLRSFMELQNVDLGFRPSGVLTVHVSPPESDYPGEEAVQAYYDRAETELASLPGIEVVGQTRPLPMNHATWTLQFARPGRAPATPEEWPVAHRFNVSSGYFDAMGVALLSGRGIEETDRSEAPAVVVVSRSLAEAHWPGDNPVGESLWVGDPTEPLEATIVGVVSDVTHEGFESSLRPQLYRPLHQSPNVSRFFVLRHSGAGGADAGAVVASVRSALARVDPNLPLEIRPMGDVVAENTLQWSIGSVLLGVFGLAALFLASLGIYGLIAYSVAERRREIGIRMALGATASDIRNVIVGEGLRLTVTGMGIGLVLAAVAARMMATMLFGVSPFDPVTFVAVVLIFLSTALVSSLIPAASAARTEPIGVLRDD